MTEITVHTGGQSDYTTIHLDWFDEDNVRLTNKIEVIIAACDKPRTMLVEVDGVTVAEIVGPRVTYRGPRSAYSKCHVAGCERYATLNGPCHALCKMHENGPCARCRQLAGETIPLTSACWPVNR